LQAAPQRWSPNAEKIVTGIGPEALRLKKRQRRVERKMIGADAGFSDCHPQNRNST
jgi:hypothetical protein